MKKLIAMNGNIRRSARIARVALVLTGIGVITCAALTPQAAMAQDPNKKISLNFQNAPIQTVLKTLFNSQGINNTIDSDVQGNVNININDVSFDVALRSLLRSASPPLTFDVQDGIYHIRVKTNNPTATVNVNPNPTPDSTPDVPTPRTSKMNLYKLPIDRYDAYYIARLITSAKSVIVQVLPNVAQRTNGSGGGQGGSSGGSSGGFGGSSGGGGGFGGSSGGGGGIGGF